MRSPLAIAGVISLAVMQVSVSFPQALLWLLGPQYSSLRFETQLAVGAGAVSFFSSVLWCIHSARKFVYWWNVGLSISLTIGVQILFIVKADMSTVRGVLMLTVATNVASLFVNMLSGAYGFLKGGRETEPRPLLVPESTVEAEAFMDLYPLKDDAGILAIPVTRSAAEGFDS